MLFADWNSSSLSSHPISYNPIAEAVYFVEGCGQGEFGANWGDGFVTDASLVKAGSSNDPNPFFTAVVGSKHKCGCFLLLASTFMRLMCWSLSQCHSNKQKLLK